MPDMTLCDNKIAH